MHTKHLSFIVNISFCLAGSALQSLDSEANRVLSSPSSPPNSSSTSPEPSLHQRQYLHLRHPQHPSISGHQQTSISHHASYYQGIQDRIMYEDDQKKYQQRFMNHHINQQREQQDQRREGRGGGGGTDSLHHESSYHVLQQQQQQPHHLHQGLHQHLTPSPSSPVSVASSTTSLHPPLPPLQSQHHQQQQHQNGCHQMREDVEPYDLPCEDHIVDDEDSEPDDESYEQFLRSENRGDVNMNTKNSESRKREETFETRREGGGGAYEGPSIPSSYVDGATPAQQLEWVGPGEEMWRGTSIAQLRRKAYEHTASMALHR